MKYAVIHGILVVCWKHGIVTNWKWDYDLYNHVWQVWSIKLECLRFLATSEVYYTRIYGKQCISISIQIWHLIKDKLIICVCGRELLDMTSKHIDRKGMSLTSPTSPTSPKKLAIPCIVRYGGFLKWGYLLIIYFNKIFHSKPSIMGCPHLWKPPYGDVNNKLGVASANTEVCCLGNSLRSSEEVATMMEMNHHNWPKK